MTARDNINSHVRITEMESEASLMHHTIREAEACTKFERLGCVISHSWKETLLDLSRTEKNIMKFVTTAIGPQTSSSSEGETQFNVVEASNTI